MIAIMKHLFIFKNRTLDETFRIVLLRLLFKEKIGSTDSKIFTIEFIESYSPKCLYVVAQYANFSVVTEFFTFVVSQMIYH